MAQDEDWYRQELRYRREERQISVGWFWPFLLALQLFLIWSGVTGRNVWLNVMTAVVSAVMGVRAWALWFQHRRARSAFRGDKPEPPAA